ncbi:MAG: Co2+/Mg2+ efflux protein ApaG [Flavobacteriia bacterium]|nr:Co2+/Mg2+ efflux protein ApaG [Flavobacteriia bacterium]
MVTKTTSGVKVSVNVKFCPKTSFLEENSFIYKYTIFIENNTEQKVQLIKRNWHIFDSLNEPYEVEGFGVIGLQPILDIKQKHQYSSFCEIKSDIGYMEGYYEFLNLNTNKRFKVIIPRFPLFYPWKAN